MSRQGSIIQHLNFVCYRFTIHLISDIAHLLSVYVLHFTITTLGLHFFFINNERTLYRLNWSLTRKGFRIVHLVRDPFGITAHKASLLVTKSRKETKLRFIKKCNVQRIKKVSFFKFPFLVQNEILVIIPMALRENAISVCCWVFLKIILITTKSEHVKKNYVL